MGDEEGGESGEFQGLRDDIVKAQSDQARKKELYRRLKVKLGSLKDEVLQREKEVELVERELEFSKDAKSQSKGKEERLVEARNDEMKKAVHKFLGERIPLLIDAGADAGDDGGGGGAIADAKGDKGKEQGEAVHDTVLVVYKEVRQYPPYPEYKATFRIDKDTTIKELHEDTCEYWGSSTKEFMLFRVGSEDYKEAAKIREEDEDKRFIEALAMKLHYPRPPVPRNILFEQLPDNEATKKPFEITEKGSLVAVLNPREAAQLYLVDHSKYKEWIEEFIKEKKAQEKKDAAAKAPAAEDDKDKDKVMETIQAQQANQPEPYVAAFQQWLGIWNLLKLRDKSDTKPRIKCSDVCFYILLALITALNFNFRSSNQYYLHHGVDELLVDGLTGYSFNDIQTHEHAFKWLRETFYTEIFDNTSTLQQNYQPIGVLRLRQQMVDKTACTRYKVAQAMGINPYDCLHVKATPETYRQTPILVNISSWLNPNITGRISDVTSVRQFNDVPAADAPWPSQSYPLRGKAQNEYGTTGMVVDYLLDRGNLTVTGNTFLQDLDVLQKYWITPATRMFLIEFVMVNTHFDRFVNVAFLMEMPPSGRILPTPIINDFAMGPPVDGEGMAANMDFLRAILVFYIWFLKGLFEIQYRMHYEKTGWVYIFSILGTLDATTVATFLCMFYARLNMADESPLDYYGKGQTKFRSYYKSAWTFEHIFLLEAIFFLLVMIRIASFARLSKAIFVFGKMFKMVLKDYFYFSILLLPMFWGMVFLAHSIWSPYLYSFSTWSEALLSLMIFIKGDLDIRAMNREARVWCGVFMGVFFLMIICFFVNGMVGIVVHAYFNTQLLHGYNRKTYQSWTWNEWKYWMCGTLCAEPPEEDLGPPEGDEDELSEGEKEDEEG